MHSVYIKSLLATSFDGMACLWPMYACIYMYIYFKNLYIHTLICYYSLRIYSTYYVVIIWYNLRVAFTAGVFITTLTSRWPSVLPSGSSTTGKKSIYNVFKTFITKLSLLFRCGWVSIACLANALSEAQCRCAANSKLWLINDLNSKHLA